MSPLSEAGRRDDSLIVLLDDVDEAPAELWAQEGLLTYGSREWLAASRWPGDGVRYLVAGSLMVPVRKVVEPGAWSRMNLVDICAGTAFDIPADPALVAAARMTTVPHLLVAAPGYYTVPIGGPASDLAGLVDAVCSLARRHSLPAGFAYLPPQAEPLLAALRERGFQTGIVSATTTLNLAGTSFDDYLAALPRRRRVSVRREMSRFAEAGGSIEHFAGHIVAGQLAVVAELESELQRSHGFGADPQLYLTLNRAFLGRFGARMHVLRASLRGETVATVTLLRTGDDLVVRTLGMRDRPDVRAAMVYFNLTYYGSVALGYRLGVRQMWFGPSALDAKRWRGLRAVPLSAAIDPRAAEHLGSLLVATDACLRPRLIG